MAITIIDKLRKLNAETMEKKQFETMEILTEAINVLELIRAAMIMQTGTQSPDTLRQMIDTICTIPIKEDEKVVAKTQIKVLLLLLGEEVKEHV